MKTITGVTDLKNLCESLGWPLEIRLPWNSWRNLFLVAYYCANDIQIDDAGAYVAFQGVKLYRPRPTGEEFVDLSGEPEE